MPSSLRTNLRVNRPIYAEGLSRNCAGFYQRVVKNAHSGSRAQQMAIADASKHIASGEFTGIALRKDPLELLLIAVGKKSWPPIRGRLVTDIQPPIAAFHRDAFEIYRPVFVHLGNGRCQTEIGNRLGVQLASGGRPSVPESNASGADPGAPESKASGAGPSICGTPSSGAVM